MRILAGIAALSSWLALTAAPTLAEQIGPGTPGFVNMTEKGLRGRPRAIANDGSWVLLLDSSSQPVNAARWRAGGRVEDIGQFIRPEGAITEGGTSLDGSTYAISVSSPDGGARFYRWTAASGFIDGGPIAGVEGRITAISPDGQILLAANGYSGEEKFLFWTQAAGFMSPPNGFGFPANSRWSSRVAISSGARVIAGTALTNSSATSNGGEHIFRWSKETGYQNLGLPTPTTRTFTANVAMSSDGATLAGEFDDSDGVKLYIWKPETGFQILEVPGAKSLYLNAISEDGSRILAAFWGVDDRGYAFSYDLKEMERQQKKRIAAAGKRQSEQQASEYSRLQQQLKNAKPAQIYAKALDFEAQNAPEMASAAYRILIDKYPDSPYTAKAIDKMEGIRPAAPSLARPQPQAQPQQQQELQRVMDARMAEVRRQARERCVSSCDIQMESCRSQFDDASTKSLMTGTITALGGKNDMAAMNSFQRTMDIERQKSQCTSQREICVNSCP